MSNSFMREEVKRAIIEILEGEITNTNLSNDDEVKKLLEFWAFTIGRNALITSEASSITIEATQEVVANHFCAYADYWQKLTILI
jgi:hypothetical protein